MIDIVAYTHQAASVLWIIIALMYPMAIVSTVLYSRKDITKYKSNDRRSFDAPLPGSSLALDPYQYPRHFMHNTFDPRVTGTYLYVDPQRSKVTYITMKSTADHFLSWVMIINVTIATIMLPPVFVLVGGYYLWAGFRDRKSELDYAQAVLVDNDLKPRDCLLG